MMGFAGCGGLGASAGIPAVLIPQRHQAAKVDRDVVRLALVRVLYLAVLDGDAQMEVDVRSLTGVMS
jgi:hypothetical protein